MKISYSAPAKVILSGEHAVVYGKPGLVSAIDLRLKFSLFENSRLTKDKSVLLVSREVKEYLQSKKIKFSDKKFNFSIESQILEGRGLGWSTAILAAEVGAFLKFYSGKDFPTSSIHELAYRIEKLFYKKTSGVDISAACYGGLIFYRREFEFLKNISLLSFKIPNMIEEKLYLIDSGKPAETTAEIVNQVGKLYNQKPSFTEEVLADIERVTKRMTVSLIKEDISFFEKNLVDNQVLLEMLGVVSQKTKRLLDQLSRFGVGKLTGAGGKKTGSGFILFFANKTKELEGFLREKRLSYYKYQQDFDGVKRTE